MFTQFKSDKVDLLSRIVDIILDTCVEISHSVRCDENGEREEIECDGVNVAQIPRTSHPDIDKVYLYANKVVSLGFVV